MKSVLLSQNEALGLLANLGEFSLATGWETIINDKHLLNWIDQHLKPGLIWPRILYVNLFTKIYPVGTSPFDVQLSAVLVLRSIAAAPEASLHLIESGLVSALLNLLRTQQEDDEFVLQAWFFYCVWDSGTIYIILNNFRFFTSSIDYCVTMKYAS